jgi:hypothetical protein
MMPTNGLETASRQDTHYRRTDGSAETRRRPTPLRLLHLTRLAKGQGLLKGRCAGNAETARPTVASRACFRRTPANCKRCWGVAKLAGHGPASSNHLSCQTSRNHLSTHRFIKSSSTSIVGLLARLWIDNALGCMIRVRSPNPSFLPSGLGWARRKTSHPISFRALCFCTPYFFASSAINHTASPQVIAS